MKNHEKKKFWKSKKAVGLLLLAVALLSFGSTWAYYSDALAAANPFRTGHSGAAVVEDFNPDSSFLPGETVTKQIAFANTGDMDLFLRVEVPPEEGWYETSGSSVADAGLDEDYVIKKWTVGTWVENDDSIGASAEEEYQLNQSGNYQTQETDLWTAAIKDEDTGKSYRYYKKILKVGETTDPILDAIKLSTLVSNDRHADDYSKKIYRVTFNAEAVPVEAEGEDNHINVQSEWGMSVEGSDSTGLTWNKKSN